MRRAILVVGAVVALAGAARAQDEAGTVSVVESKTIWKQDGMTVKRAQFTPDGARIVFAAEGQGRLLIASVSPGGDDVRTLWEKGGFVLTHLGITPEGSHVAAIVTRNKKQTPLVGPAAGPLVTVERTEAEAKPGRNAVLFGWEPDEPRVTVGAVRSVLRSDLRPTGGPYKCEAISPGGELHAATRDLPSPVGVVRGAGLWAWRLPDGFAGRLGPVEVLSPKEWLVGVAYYKHMIAWAPPEEGRNESRRIRFVGARLKPFPGKKHRPLCVWEVTIDEELEPVGKPVRLGTFGWWPRYFRGDPALHGCTGWNYSLGAGQYLADFSTGKVYKFDKTAFGRGTRATYNPGCTLAALPGKTLRVLKLKKTEN